MLLAASGGAFAQPAEGPPFRTVAKGSAPLSRSVVTTVTAYDAPQWEGSWQLLWSDPSGQAAQPPMPLPVVDFRRSMLLGVVLASNPTGCAGVSITGLQLRPGQLVVRYQEKRRQRGEACTSAYPTAYHFVSTPRSSLPVVFEHEPMASADTTATAQTRCGWFDNPTPGNAWLHDREGEWTVGIQGGHQAEGDWPSFSAAQWVRTNGSHGYGCACLRVVVELASRQVVRIASATARPLSACRGDKALKKPPG
ncbi:MAG TPA: DUF4087 domain-containing protein [Rhizobacter sp.]|nr:DUF4087 domain-containing protein [Rhizobacter sp.]